MISPSWVNSTTPIFWIIWDFFFLFSFFSLHFCRRRRRRIKRSVILFGGERKSFMLPRSRTLWQKRPIPLVTYLYYLRCFSSSSLIRKLGIASKLLNYLRCFSSSSLIRKLGIASKLRSDPIGGVNNPWYHHTPLLPCQIVWFSWKRTSRRWSSSPRGKVPIQLKA